MHGNHQGQPVPLINWFPIFKALRDDPEYRAQCERTESRLAHARAAMGSKYCNGQAR